MKHLKLYEAFNYNLSLEDRINVTLSEIDIDGDDVLEDCPLIKRI
jgi:hypothetical protein